MLPLFHAAHKTWLQDSGVQRPTQPEGALPCHQVETQTTSDTRMGPLGTKASEGTILCEALGSFLSTSHNSTRSDVRGR